MQNKSDDLARAIADAQKERSVWHAGRLAYRQKKELALNPYPPGTTEHRLWSDGVRDERDEMRRSLPQRISWIAASKGNE